MAAKPTQNNLLWAPTKELAKARKSAKEVGAQETCNQDLIQHQKSLARTQLKKYEEYLLSSHIEHNSQNPDH